MLSRLRELPEHHREGLAFGLALSVTLIIALVWISVFPARLGNDRIVITKDDVEEARSAKNAPSPVESIKESLAGVSSSIGELSKIFKSLKESDK